MQPVTLYHYTDAAGLIGVLTGGKLWATQLQHMNDHKEDAHGYFMAAKQVYELARLETGSKQAHLVEIGHRLRTAEGGSFRCAFCLSENPDLLSQWRGYTPNGGYAIGFRVDVLRAVATRNGLQLSPCLYHEREQLDALSSVLSPVINSYQQWDIDEAELQQRINRITTASEPIRSVIKHSSFAEESEWRVHGSISASDSRTRWRPSGEYVRPYAEIALAEDGSRAKDAVCEVWIGPGSDSSRASAAVTHMMVGLGFEKIDVRWSASPFRR